ncbi:MAG: hypothetical protein KY468_02075 [Armatimonadetes bacterium]|nr:hypothetical protein [Armatimonadota bacterium]
MSEVLTLSPGDSLSRATQLLPAGAQHVLPTVEDARNVGLLNRVALGDSFEVTFRHMTEAEAWRVPILEVG